MSVEAVELNSKVDWNPDAHRMTATLSFPLTHVSEVNVSTQSGDIFVGPQLPGGEEVPPQLKVKLGFYAPTVKSAVALLEEQTKSLFAGTPGEKILVDDQRSYTPSVAKNALFAYPVSKWHEAWYGHKDPLDSGLLLPRCDVFVVPPVDAAVSYKLQTVHGDIAVVSATGTDQNYFRTHRGDVTIDGFSGNSEIALYRGSVNARVSSGDVYVTAARLSKLTSHVIAADAGSATVFLGNRNVRVKANALSGKVSESAEFHLQSLGNQGITVARGRPTLSTYVSVRAAKEIIIAGMPKNGNQEYVTMAQAQGAGRGR